MAPLEAELERVGFTDVGTIAQSGNVLVTTDRDARGTARAVEEAVLASSGTVTVAVPIHGEELREVLEVGSQDICSNWLVDALSPTSADLLYVSRSPNLS